MKKSNHKKNGSGGVDVKLTHPVYGLIDYTLNEKEIEEIPEGTIVAELTPGEVEGVTAGRVLADNEKHRKYLADTDCFTLRFLETGKAVPPGITKGRQAARDAIA